MSAGRKGETQLWKGRQAERGKIWETFLKKTADRNWSGERKREGTRVCEKRANDRGRKEKDDWA